LASLKSSSRLYNSHLSLSPISRRQIPRCRSELYCLLVMPLSWNGPFSGV
jgi:hypothetical protein